ncbi:hypothetical protein [Sphingomonas melonis]
MPADDAAPKRFQRVGALSNTHAGRDFQDAVHLFLSRVGLVLEREFPVAVGHAVKKLHRFDLGSDDPDVLVECKSYTWTAGGNSPSAKIRGLNEAMLLFSVAPPHYRKLLVMLRHLRRKESLGTNWLRNHGHLVPPGVEIWELDPVSGEGTCLLGGDGLAAR